MTVVRANSGPVVRLRRTYWARVAEHTWWSFVVGFLGLLVGNAAVDLNLSTLKIALAEGVTSVLMFFYKMAQERLVELDKLSE